MNSTVQSSAEQAIEQIDLEKIDLKNSPMARAIEHEQTIREYWDCLVDGVQFPPIVLFWVEILQAYVIADGLHRYHAHLRNNESTIAAIVYKGSPRDALLHAITANQQHGLRRTEADKRLAVRTMLEDAEWGGWSDRVIAAKLSVSHPLVAKVRKELMADISDVPTSDEACETLPKVPTGNISSSREARSPARPKAVQAQTRRTGADGKVRQLPQPKVGSEEIPPEQRKQVKEYFGQFTRAVSKVDRWKTHLRPLLDTIAESMATEWGTRHETNRDPRKLGNERAQQAINCLKSILADDEQRDEALATVAEWIEQNANDVSFNPATFEAVDGAPDVVKLAAPYSAAVKSLQAIRRTMKKLAEDERYGTHLADKITRIDTELETAQGTIRTSEPSQLCDKCSGEGCQACRNTGVWTRMIVQSRKR